MNIPRSFNDIDTDLITRARRGRRSLVAIRVSRSGAAFSAAGAGPRAPVRPGGSAARLAGSPEMGLSESLCNWPWSLTLSLP